MFTSSADLNNIKFATLPNLRVRRRQRIVSTEVLDCSSDSLNSTIAMHNDPCKGPEFIAKSSLPAKHIDITDIKVVNHIKLCICNLLIGLYYFSVPTNSDAQLAYYS